jgi:hypothetical protein
MRLSRIAKPFDDPDYVFELKHDGFRVLAYIGASECKVVSRNLNQFQSFASLKESLGKMLVQNAIIDGEVVCLDAQGVSRFNELMSLRGKPICWPVRREPCRQWPGIGGTLSARRCRVADLAGSGVCWLG